MINKSVLDIFHPAVREWFQEYIGVPSPPQEQGWPAIYRNENALITAPTGAGKTLAAFLVCINWLLEQGIHGKLQDQTYVLYISPLKALNNDIYRNLELPLEGIEKVCNNLNIPFPNITKAVRTGDTTAYDRQKMLRKPPHILITTPESLYLLLTSKKARNILRNIRYVIVDEIHALFGNKRGVHLTLSLERLRHLIGQDFIRIGLSATVNPMEEAARFLGGCHLLGEDWQYRPVTIVAPTMDKKVDLEVVVPVHDYRVLEEGTIWPSIYETIYHYILEHKSTLVFVNNRATAEKIAANLNFMALKTIAQTHHGSISKESRLVVENQLKAGELPCLVATSSLELGIDVGDIELIIQVASPKSAGRGLQRLGRAGHRLNAVSKGRIIPRTRGDLLDSVVISREMLNKHIEEEKVPKNALDIIAQHLVSMACTEDWKLDDILLLIRSSYPFHTIKTEEVIKVLNMLAGEYEHREDVPKSPRIYWDRVNEVMMGNGYSKMLAIGGGGTIPDRGYYGVYLEDKVTRLGELDEEFVFEARINDRFLLGTSAWRIVRIERDRVLVASSGYSGAKTPFWKGEGLGRPYTLGVRYGEFIREMSSKAGKPGFAQWLMSNAPVSEDAVRNLEEYILEQKDALGAISSERLIIVECFSDEVGDTRIVIHSHFGGRVNSGLAVLFEHALTTALHCEVEVNYTDDGVLLHFVGLTTQPKNIFSLLNSNNVEEVLIETLPLTHVYAMAFRYNAGRALMMGIGLHGKRNPLWIQRLRGLEALKLAQKYTDHPLVIETFRECLEYIMDVPSLIHVIKQIESGSIEILERFTNKPSPFTSELLFGFVGEAMYDPQVAKSKEIDQKIVSGTDALNLNYQLEGQGLIAETALEEIAAYTNPLLRVKPIQSANELHGILLTYGDIYPEDEIFKNLSDDYKDELKKWFNELCSSDELGSSARAYTIQQSENDPMLWIAAEEMSLYRIAFELEKASVMGISTLEAQKRIIRRFARYNSPFVEDDLVTRYGFSIDAIARILEELEQEEILIYGNFRQAAVDEWYHRLILEKLRNNSMRTNREVTITADPPALACFIANYQHIGKEWVLPAEGLLDVIVQMKGMYLPVEWWESIIFPARVPGYKPSHLDTLCATGKVLWRIHKKEDGQPRLAFYTMEDFEVDAIAYSIKSLQTKDNSNCAEQFSENEINVLTVLSRRGACFLHTLAADSSIDGGGLLQTMEELFWKGYVVNDSFEAVRYFLSGTADNVKRRAQRRAIAYRMEMGRWEISSPVQEPGLEQLLERYLIRWGLLTKEIYNSEESLYPWAAAYGLLKQWEYIGKVKRGYYFSGLSGIQYLLPHVLPQLTSTSEDFIVLIGCDTAQIYGRICSFPAEISWSCLPSTAIVMHSGVPVLTAERWGERISTYALKHMTSNATNALEDITSKAINALADAFHSGRIWSNRRKITIKQWDGQPPALCSYMEDLRGIGFERELQDMVLWRHLR